MGLGYDDKHVYEIAIYSETCTMKGRVCLDPSKYGDDWRESPDLEVYSGTEAELTAQALETMNRAGVKMHAFRSAKAILDYLRVEICTRDGRWVVAQPDAEDAD